MSKTLISPLIQIFEQPLPQDDKLRFQVEGWVKQIRHAHQNLTFVQLNDGSSPQDLQIVLSGDQIDHHELCRRLTIDCALRVEGSIIALENRKQDREMQALNVEVLGWVEDPATYPIAKKKHTLEHLRSHLHLRPRTRTFQAISHLRSILAQEIHQFFQSQSFLWLPSPILTAADCEGAGEAFEVVTEHEASSKKCASELFFGKKAHLTVSGQLHGECYASALSRVYTFGPTFRAENSNTTRHLSEFWMVEPEMAFCDLEGIRNLAMSMMRSVARGCLDRGAAWIEMLSERSELPLEARLRTLVDHDYCCLDYNEAIKILQKAPVTFDYPVVMGMDLQSEHERYLAERYVQGPLFVQNYPTALKAFYMRRNDADPSRVSALDLLVPGMGEILGGSQREERHDFLVERMKQCDIDPEQLDWFLDLRRYGSVPHSGFGLGFERLLSYLGGISNIRDATPFPRAPHCLAC